MFEGLSLSAHFDDIISLYIHYHHHIFAAAPQPRVDSSVCRTMDATRLPLVLAFLTICVFTHSHAQTIVRTTHGDVRGLQKSVLGRPVNVYWGIPYAKVPARFQRPERAAPWQGVFDAVTPPPSCPEVPYIGDIPVIPPTTTPFEENCLFLNLWVPQGCLARDGKSLTLASMVWIHGGSCEQGSTTVPVYDGQVLAATQCVIVASMNYRLGPLGFLSLGNDRAPGNVGVLDQNMALRWIHENIHSFGGSPDQITLFGESAGGISVGAHMASPLSQDLFSRAIMQSGVPTETWGKQTVSQNQHNARELAKLVGCPSDDDPDSIIACLSGVDSVELSRAVNNIPNYQIPGFRLIVDGLFLSEPLAESFFRGGVKKFDVMLGVNKNDASFILPLLIMGHTAKEGRPEMDRNMFQQLLAGLVLQVMTDTPENVSLVSKLVEYIYVSSSPPVERDNYCTALEKVLQDLLMVCPMYSTATPFVGYRDVFMYSFDHRSSVTPFPEWMGVVHASELDLVFGRPLDKEELFTDQERQLSNVMMTAWANFAKFG